MEMSSLRFPSSSTRSGVSHVPVYNIAAPLFRNRSICAVVSELVHPSLKYWAISCVYWAVAIPVSELNFSFPILALSMKSFPSSLKALNAG